MYLFSRRARLAPGNTHDSMAWATSITEKVNQIVSLNTGLFAQTFSPEVGTLVWSTFVPDLATLEPATHTSSAPQARARDGRRRSSPPRTG